MLYYDKVRKFYSEKFYCKKEDYLHEGIRDELTGEEARQFRAQCEPVEKEIATLRAELKKETQFSRKVELNMRIKKLERDTP